MKNAQCCIKCNQGKIFHAHDVLDRGEGNAGLPMAIGRSGVIHAHDFGTLEAYICMSCGYTEFYVQNPRELEDVQPDTGGIGLGEVRKGGPCA